MIGKFFEKQNGRDWKLISRHLNEVIFLLDKEGKILYSTISSKDFLGYDASELTGNNLSNYIQLEDLPHMKSFLETCRQEGQCNQKFWFSINDDPVKRFYLNAQYITEESKIIVVLNRLLDARYRKSYVQLHDNQYKFMMNNMTDCIILIDKKGNVTQSVGIEEMLGYKDSDIIGGSAFVPVHPDDRQKTLDVFNEFIEKGALVTSRHDYRIQNARGEYIWVEANFRVIQDIKTGEYKILNNLRDITERKQMEKDLRNINHTKDKLFSIIAHDLKSPMNNLNGFAWLLKNEYNKVSEEEIKSHIDSIYRSSTQLKILLDNLLNWSRAHFSKLTVSPEEVSLESLINRTLPFFEESLSRKQIEIDMSIQGVKSVYVDPEMLKVVIRNLISNAIKFSYPKSTIRIGLINEFQSYETLYIEDYGTGISEDAKNKLLEEASFISTRGTMNEKGTGLGLKITEEFVKKNKGEIWFDTEKDKGTRVYLKLPHRLSE